MKHTANLKTALCLVGLLFSQLMATAQSNELAMESGNESYTVATTVSTESVAYEITDVTGNNIAAGQLTINTSLAVNVSVGTYKLRITGAQNQPVTETVVIGEQQATTPISTGSTTNYIVVKVDKDGTFTYNKMSF